MATKRHAAWAEREVLGGQDRTDSSSAFEPSRLTKYWLGFTGWFKNIWCFGLFVLLLCTRSETSDWFDERVLKFFVKACCRRAVELSVEQKEIVSTFR